LVDGKILVTGATGTQGGAVTAALQRAGFDVVVLVRPGGAQRVRPLLNGHSVIAEGDLDDVESLVSACAGCSGVFSVQLAPLADADSERRQARNLIGAAKGAGVQHFVHSSVSGTGWRTRYPHVDSGVLLNYWDSKEDVEAMVRDARFPAFTILKPAFIMENFIAPKVDWLFPHLRIGDLLIGTGPDTVMALIAAADIGLATVAAMADPQRFNGAEIELAGDAPTVAEIAAVIEHAAGRPVKPVCVSTEEVDARLGARSWSATHEWLGRVGYPARPEDAEPYRLSPTTFTLWAQQHRAELKAATTPQDSIGVTS
jgi:uncharacterized protein YbjT (DUF2867 family)